MTFSDKDSNRATTPDERIAALEKSVREKEAELLTLYTNTAIHLAMIREDTAEHTRLCDLPELDAAWNVLTPDAQKRSTQASVDLYALVAAADPGYALLLGRLNAALNESGRVEGTYWKHLREMERERATMAEERKRMTAACADPL